MLRAWVGMTGPVIRERASRTTQKGCTPANHPVSGLPLSYASPCPRVTLSAGQLICIAHANQPTANR
jgi:hypothetical protein